VIYKPSKTIAQFMKSDALVKAIIGPLGSGKSMGGQMELFRRMVQQEPDSRGIRPTRFVIVRNTAAQLRETVLSDAKQYFGDYFEHKVSTQTMEFRFPLGDGTYIESDWLLMPLERPEDQRKLLSLNITSAMIEECREVPYNVVASVLGRIGRYPSMARVKPTWQALLMISNPWSQGSPYHENLVLKKPDDWDFFHQPGGLDPDAENREFLPEDYYERLTEGQSDEWIKVHVHSQFGEDQFGQAVYKAVFRRDHHVYDTLKPTPMLPIVLGMDFGRTPCAIITQQDIKGRLLCLHEVNSADMGLHTFLHEKLIPFLNENYPSYKVFVMGDPAGMGKDQYTEASAFSIIKQAGLEAMPAPTNDPMKRIEAVEKRLLQNNGQTADMLISKEGCPTLIEGFMRGYMYKKRKDGELTPLPDKNDYSHIHDAMQYAALAHQTNFVSRRLLKQERRKHMVHSRKHPSPRAWT